MLDIFADKPPALRGSTEEQIKQLWSYLNGLVDFINMLETPTRVTNNGYTSQYGTALASISVTTPPTTTTYDVGDTLDLTGIVVTATYYDGATADVTSECVFSPAEGTTLSTTGTQTVTVTYTEGGVTLTARFDVTVGEITDWIESRSGIDYSWIETDLRLDVEEDTQATSAPHKWSPSRRYLKIGRYETCETCGGTGEVEPYGKTCTTCDGTGYNGEESCPACHGTGIVDGEMCAECNGSGTVPTICSTCNGTGCMESTTCPDCEGTGEIILYNGESHENLV